MVATIQKTNLRNAFSTTLSAQMGPTDLTATVVSTSGLTSPCLLVIEPESATQREYILFDGTFTATTVVATDIARRYLAGSAAGSGLTHPSGSVVRMAPFAQHIEMANDRIDQLFVNVKDYGAVGDGTTDDTTAIQDAIDAVEAALLAGYDQTANPWDVSDASQVPSTGTIYLPPGVYAISSRLELKVRRAKLQGAGAYHTTIRPLGGFTPTTDPLLLLTQTGTSGESGRQFVEGIFFDANSVTDYAMVLHRADRSHIKDCIFGRANSHGVYRHDTFGGAAAGSCHSMVFEYCLFIGNGGSGCYDEQRSNLKNNTTWLNCFASGNADAGLLVKGQDNTIQGGNYLSNTDAGIQFGETGDSGVTTGALLLFPWIEGNVGTRQGSPAGGVGIHCENAARILAILGPQAQQSLVDGATADDKDTALTVVKYGQEGVGFLRGSDESYGQMVVGGSGAPRIKSGSGSPEGVEKAPIGSIFLRLDGGASTALYVKESGTPSSSTGWVAK